MTPDTHSRKPLWIAFIALTVLTVVVASDGRAQGGVTDISKAITVDFAILPSGVSVPPSFQIAGMTFFAHSPPEYYAGPRIVDWDPPHERSYSFSENGVTVVLPLEARAVDVRLCLFAPGDELVEAYSSTGTLVAEEQPQIRNCDDLLLKGAPDSDLISIVRFTGGRNEASIARLSAILSTAPVVDAGEDQVVLAGSQVYLQGTAWDPYSGSASSGGPFACTTGIPPYCPEPLFASFFWEQTDDGTEVSLDSDYGIDYRIFTAPYVSVEETLSFRLTVTNYDGETGSDDVRVIVRPCSPDQTSLRGWLC